MNKKNIPYGRQSVDSIDIKEVAKVLKSDWLTTGPKVDEFEESVASFTGSKFAVAVSSGTAGLHAAMFAIGIKSGDEVIVPSMTFAATANCVVYQGGTPIFADIVNETLLIDPLCVEALITSKTKAIITVDYAGQPINYDALKMIALNHGLHLISDASHSIGAFYDNKPIGSLADLTVFSFHPVKNMTTGEGGMILTNDEKLYRRLIIFRNHGITTDHLERSKSRSWFYEMIELGYNYRITDFQCALGMSQLKKLPKWIKKRQIIAKEYNKFFLDRSGIIPLKLNINVTHAYHLYVVKFENINKIINRDMFFQYMKKHKIDVNLHYIPVHLHPFYKNNFGTKEGICPVSELVFKEIITLPLFPLMKLKDLEYIKKVITSFFESNS